MDPKILYLQYANPGTYPPVQHSSRFLAESGWRVWVLGIATYKTERMIFPAQLRTKVVLLRYCPPGWRQKLHYFYYGLWALSFALLWRPKCVYASDSLSCPVALALSFLPGLQVIYHEHDCPSQTYQPVNLSRSIRFTLWCRGALARRAAFSILPNRQRIELFAAQTSTLRPLLCVWNCPRKAEVKPQKTETIRPGMLRLLFVGSINRDRLPLSVLQAMMRFPGRVELSVVGFETIGAKDYLAEFLNHADALGIARAVDFIGALPRQDIFEPASKCDVGLAFMPLQSGDINMLNMTGASNKPFDYLACGVALLVSDLPDWKAMFVGPGYGLACNPEDTDSIATQIEWFLEHPEETRAMGERGRQRICSEWNYEAQFQPALNRLIVLNENT